MLKKQGALENKENLGNLKTGQSLRETQEMNLNFWKKNLENSGKM